MSHTHPVIPEDLDASAGEFICEACTGDGEIDERLGGFAFNCWVDCPDCDGKGYWNEAPT